MIERDGIHGADLGNRPGSRPVKRRPVLVVQSDPDNASRLATVLAVVVTSNTALAAMPGNVSLPAAVSGLSRDSVVNITALVTLNKSDLTDRVGHLPLTRIFRGMSMWLGVDTRKCLSCNRLLDFSRGARGRPWPWLPGPVRNGPK